MATKWFGHLDLKVGFLLTNQPIGITDGKKTTPNQKTVIGNLLDITAKVERAKLISPCLIIIGEVVGLHDTLSWYGEKVSVDQSQ